MTNKQLSIWITRPALEANSLARVLKPLANIWVLPLLEIQPLNFGSIAHKLPAQPDFQHLIFISRYAAKMGLELLLEHYEYLPKVAHWWTVGSGTAAFLQFQCISARYPPHPSSESLLNCSALEKIKGQRILLVKGVGGRSFLKTELKARGAKVTTLSVYKRVRPCYDTLWVQEEFLKRNIDLIIATSGEIVKNLSTWIVGESCQAFLFVPSQRVQRLAYEHGFKNVVVMQGASDLSVKQAILSWRNKLC